jgi:hypothetical protein
MEVVMQNVKAEVKGTKLLIEIDLAAEGKPSASGKSLVIASTKGNKPVANGFLGVNFYIPA